MTMTTEEASLYLKQKFREVEEQHAYVQEARLELALRKALIPTKEAEAKWALACFHGSLGFDVDWVPLREMLKEARRETEKMQKKARKRYVRK